MPVMVGVGWLNCASHVSFSGHRQYSASRRKVRSPWCCQCPTLGGRLTKDTTKDTLIVTEEQKGRQTDGVDGGLQGPAAAEEHLVESCPGSVREVGMVDLAMKSRRW